MTKPNIKMVFFDLGNVLFKVDHTNAWEQTKADSDLSLDELYERFYQSGDVIEHMIGNIDDSTFFRRLKNQLEFKESEQRLLEIWASVFSPIPLRLQFVGDLSDKIPVGVISNISHVHSNKIEHEVSEMNVFSHTLYSWECRFMKPRPEIFNKAIEYCGKNSSECLFLDDQQQHVDAAKKLGWQANQIKLDDDMEKIINSSYSF